MNATDLQDLPASAAKKREDLAELRPDVVRVAAGVIANPNIGQLINMDGERPENPEQWVADWVARLSLAIVRAVDDVCTDEPSSALESGEASA